MTYSVRSPGHRSAWRVGGFARLTGVTVKALHYYERIGLLAPRRTRAGYRRYTLRDLARLERIIALKTLGLPLKQITPMLGSARLKPRAPADKIAAADKGAPANREAPANRKEREALAERRGRAGAKEREAFLGAEARSAKAAAERSRLRSRETMANFGVAGTLGAHRDKLLEKRRLLGEAIAAIDAVARACDPDAALQKFVGESTWARYEAKRARLADPAPRAPDRASPSRFALFHEIKDALDRDPSGESARPLAARWHALIEAEAEGNAETVAAMRKISATRAKWPDGARRYVASLYDADIDTWERVMAFVSQRT